MYFHSPNNKDENPALSPTVFEWHTKFRLSRIQIRKWRGLPFVPSLLHKALFAAAFMFVFKTCLHFFSFVTQLLCWLSFVSYLISVSEPYEFYSQFFIVYVSSFSLWVHAYCFLLEYSISGSTIQTVSTMFAES
jgi:hypothetical protein